MNKGSKKRQTNGCYIVLSHHVFTAALFFFSCKNYLFYFFQEPFDPEVNEQAGCSSTPRCNKLLVMSKCLVRKLRAFLLTEREEIMEETHHVKSLPLQRENGLPFPLGNKTKGNNIKGFE